MFNFVTASINNRVIVEGRPPLKQTFFSGVCRKLLGHIRFLEQKRKKACLDWKATELSGSFDLNQREKAQSSKFFNLVCKYLKYQSLLKANSHIESNGFQFEKSNYWTWWQHWLSNIMPFGVYVKKRRRAWL